MINYIIRRIVLIPILLMGISMMIFSMISLLTPFDRAKALFPTDIPQRPRDYNGLIKNFGLDDPFYEQYWHWLVGKEDPETGVVLGGVLHGQLGWSQVGRSSVLDAILTRLPMTAELMLWSVVPMIGLGIWLGVKAAAKHNQPLDHVLRLVAVVGWSIPAFVSGLLLISIFYSKFNWFPPGRTSLDVTQAVGAPDFIHYTRMVTLDALLNFRFDIFFDALKHLVLPCITLSIAAWAFILRITRSAMLETLEQDYITIARSKGLPEKIIIRRHALPNALIPVITVGGLVMVGLFNTAIITEAIFNLPGLGAFLVKAADSLDLVTVAGVTLFIGAMLVFVNLSVDILYAVVDPRVRLD